MWCGKKKEGKKSKKPKALRANVAKSFILFQVFIKFLASARFSSGFLTFWIIVLAHPSIDRAGRASLARLPSLSLVPVNGGGRCFSNVHVAMMLSMRANAAP